MERSKVAKKRFKEEKYCFFPFVLSIELPKKNKLSGPATENAVNTEKMGMNFEVEAVYKEIENAIKKNNIGYDTILLFLDNNMLMNVTPTMAMVIKKTGVKVKYKYLPSGYRLRKIASFGMTKTE